MLETSRELDSKSDAEPILNILFKNIELTKNVRFSTFTSQDISKRLSCSPSAELMQEVYPIMTRDEVTTVAQSDEEIVALGNYMLQRFKGKKANRKFFISSKMRLAARLLIQLRKQTDLKSAEMSVFLTPHHFHEVVRASLVCGSPIQLGYDIKCMALIKYGRAMMNRHEEARADSEVLIKLFNMEWSQSVYRHIGFTNNSF